MKNFSKRYSSPGTKPGLIEGNEGSDFTVNLTDYNKSVIEEYSNLDLSTCRSFLENDNTTWIHVQGDPSVQAMRAIAKGLDIHDLYLEDIMNTGQRPKVESNGDELFIILNLPVESDNITKIEQVSLFITKNTVISFCSGTFMPFDFVVNRLRKNIGKLRKLPADYLMYSLIDTVIDYGFPLVEAYGQRIQELEDELLETSNDAILNQIHQLRRKVLLVRLRIWPHRDLISDILRADDNTIISANTALHMRDCFDHVVSINDTLQAYHEMAAGLMELYLASVSLKLNDVMKFLTIFTTIFIPPTFIVGVYGMNFDPQVSEFNMPELSWEFGYLGAWFIIALSISGMLLFFRKRSWI